MEINRVLGNVFGGVASQDMVEGRMVLLASHALSADFGSLTDLPAFKLPTTADEAKRAKFVLSFAEDNVTPPTFYPMPSMAWALRKGWDQAANVPFSATVRLTQPGHQIGQTVPSGTSALAYGFGTYTVVSGAYLSNASIAAGALLSVSYSGADAGKLQYSATMGDAVVAMVEQYNSTTGELTFTTI